MEVQNIYSFCPTLDSAEEDTDGLMSDSTLFLAKGFLELIAGV